MMAHVHLSSFTLSNEGEAFEYSLRSQTKLPGTLRLLEFACTARRRSHQNGRPQVSEIVESRVEMKVRISRILSPFLLILSISHSHDYEADDPSIQLSDERVSLNVTADMLSQLMV